MTQRMGTCGKDVPLETRFMLLECEENNEGPNDNSPTIYAVFLPLLEGQFRAVLQGNEKNELEICLQSGDHAVETNQGLNLVYMNAGTNPFELPGVLDWFGWCTWDAFYTDVTAEGVEDGLKSLSEGGTSPRFVIIDDGWQQIGNDYNDTNVVVQEGAQ
ncbi:probable galactinol--sucrose galactosyltransferase 2 [Tanacetum coccineum]